MENSHFIYGPPQGPAEVPGPRRPEPSDVFDLEDDAWTVKVTPSPVLGVPIPSGTTIRVPGFSQQQEPMGAEGAD